MELNTKPPEMPAHWNPRRRTGDFFTIWDLTNSKLEFVAHIGLAYRPVLVGTTSSLNMSHKLQV